MFNSIRTIKSRVTLFFGLFLVVLLLLFLAAQATHAHNKRGEFFNYVRNSAQFLMDLAEQNNKQSLDNAVFNDIDIKWDEEILSKSSQPQHNPLNDAPRMAPQNILVSGIKLKAVMIDEKNAVVLEKDGFKCIALDSRIDKVTIVTWTLFSAVLGVAVLIYWLILKSLIPLDGLKTSIKRFGEGDFDAIVDIDSDDEIGQIAKAFDAAAEQIKALLESKDIFLKNAAHELRTPITKGIITTHLLPESRDKEILLNVFGRLETISEGVLSIEHMSSKDFQLTLEPIVLSQLVAEATELLFLDKECVLAKNLDQSIVADQKLMLIVFKNLIDNGVKFAADGHILIEALDGNIWFKSQGDKLEEPTDRYFDPFFKETSVRNAKGSGIGLFLSRKIASEHGMKLWYEYADGFNCFVLS